MLTPPPSHDTLLRRHGSKAVALLILIATFAGLYWHSLEVRESRRRTLSIPPRTTSTRSPLDETPSEPGETTRRDQLPRGNLGLTTSPGLTSTPAPDKQPEHPGTNAP